MKTFPILFLILSPLFLSLSSRTGPSEIRSEIRPISINEKGEILCRTRFMANPMGARMPMPYQYGYCVLTKNSIVQIPTFRLDPNVIPSYADFWRFKMYWDSVYESCLHPDQFDMKAGELMSEYSFSECNIKEWEVNQRISHADFEERKKIDLKKIPQKALDGAQSINYFEKEPLNVLYDFGHVLILGNLEDDMDQASYGAQFSYTHPWTNREGKEELIGYEYSKVTGVLFLK